MIMSFCDWETKLWTDKTEYGSIQSLEWEGEKKKYCCDTYLRSTIRAMQLILRYHYFCSLGTYNHRHGCVHQCTEAPPFLILSRFVFKMKWFALCCGS